MFQPSSKKLLLGALVACFAVQTTLVYSDDRRPPLSEEAQRGRRIFHARSCQVCHQLYGQGGFLGPDLTNAARRVDDTRLAALLTVGSGQMPAMHLAPDEIAAVRAFLEEIDRPEQGRGQLRLGDPETAVGPQAAFERAVEESALPASAVAGFEAVRSRICATCHVPFRTSPVGAPDLTSVSARLDVAELRTVLASGRIEKGMPPPVPAFSPEELDGVVAWFAWLAENREPLGAAAGRLRAAGSVDWSRLPWWEF